MREYFYTNDDISNIMERDNKQSINWERYGFNVKDISRFNAFAQINGHSETLIPISDKTKFNKELSNLITMRQDGEFFYKVLNEEEANNKKEEFKKVKQPKLEQPVEDLEILK